MTLAPFLEDFGPATRIPVSPPEPDVIAEDQRLAAFEKGYSAGWDDALAAQADHDRRATEAFASALEDLRFPYQEALARMTSNAAPVVEAIVRQVVPELMAANIGRIVWDEVEKVLRDAPGNPVEVVVAPARSAFLAARVPEGLAVQLSVVTDDSLDTDRILLRIGRSERLVDFSHLAERLNTAMAAYLHHSQEEGQHG